MRGKGVKIWGVQNKSFKMKHYLLGYIAAVEYIGGEWSLTKGGHFSSLWTKTAAQNTGVHKNRKMALSAARSFKARNPGERVYVRPYALESNKEENLPLLETALPLEYV